MGLLITVILVALVFEYINGFHDTANSIAMGVSTKVLTPRQAIGIAATMNLIGAFMGTAVAKTVSSGIADDKVIPANLVTYVLISALIGAIIWNLVTWWGGLPSSSSHALIGGLVGGALGATHMNMGAVIWYKAGAEHWWQAGGVIGKVIIPMFLSPLVAFTIGFLIMSFLYIVLQKARPSPVNSTFKFLQIFSGSYMGLAHGQNDAQKTMGIIALALVGATTAGHVSPDSFLYLKDLGPSKDQIPAWIKFICAGVMALGTAAGGWKIVKTMGSKMVKVQPINGFTADACAATVLAAGAHFGMPLSTTHAVTTSIMGVGCAKRWSALKLSVVARIIIAWMLTLPICAVLAYLTMRVFTAFL